MYTLKVFKKDRRYASGYRLIKVIPYPHASGNSMMDECFDLRRRLYRPADGYKLEW